MAPKSDSSSQPSGSPAWTVTDGDVPNGPKEIPSVTGVPLAVSEDVALLEAESAEVLADDPVHADATIIRSVATSTRSDVEPFVAMPYPLRVCVGPARHRIARHR
jgi:hypothetical protein